MQERQRAAPSTAEPSLAVPQHRPNLDQEARIGTEGGLGPQEEGDLLPRKRREPDPPREDREHAWREAGPSRGHAGARERDGDGRGGGLDSVEEEAAAPGGNLSPRGRAPFAAPDQPVGARPPLPQRIHDSSRLGPRDAKGRKGEDSCSDADNRNPSGQAFVSLLIPRGSCSVGSVGIGGACAPASQQKSGHRRDRSSDGADLPLPRRRRCTDGVMPTGQQPQQRIRQSPPRSRAELVAQLRRAVGCSSVCLLPHPGNGAGVNLGRQGPPADDHGGVQQQLRAPAAERC